MNTQDHKAIKGLKTQNLRDHMTEAEVIFTALAELSTRQIAESEQVTGMPKNKVAAKKGAGIAKKARLDLEQKNRETRGIREQLPTAENDFAPKGQEEGDRKEQETLTWHPSTGKRKGLNLHIPLTRSQ